MSKSGYYILKVGLHEALTWYALSESGTLSHTTYENSWTNLPKLTTKDKLIVLLPGQWFFVTNVNLPKASKRNIEKALPFLIEEQLTTPMNELYIVSEKKSYGEYLVAAIEKTKLEKIFSEIKSKRYAPITLMPDFMALSLEKNKWTLWLSDETASLRTDQTHGFSALLSHFPLALQLKLRESEPPGQAIRVLSQSKILPKTLFAPCLENIKINEIDESHLFDFNLFTQKPVINFLQGRYRVKQTYGIKEKYWRYAGVAFSIWLIALFGTQIVSLVYYSKQNATLNEKITQRYQQLYPEKTMHDPKKEIQHELQQGVTPHISDFVMLMTKLGEALKKFNRLDLKTIHYQNKQLAITVRSKKLADLGNFTNFLQQEGFVILKNQVNAGKHNVVAQISMRGKLS